MDGWQHEPDWIAPTTLAKAAELPISPLVGEMPGKAEGALSREPLHSCPFCPKSKGRSAAFLHAPLLSCRTSPPRGGDWQFRRRAHIPNAPITAFDTFAQRPGSTSPAFSGTAFPAVTAGWYQLHSAWSEAE